MPNQISETVLGEAEKISFIALPGKVPAGSCIEIQSPSVGGITEEFCNNGSRLRFLLRLGCVQGLHSFNLWGAPTYLFIYLFIWLHRALVASGEIFCSGKWTLVVVPRLQYLGHTALVAPRHVGS